MTNTRYIQRRAEAMNDLAYAVRELRKAGQGRGDDEFEVLVELVEGSLESLTVLVERRGEAASLRSATVHEVSRIRVERPIQTWAVMGDTLSNANRE